MGTNDKLLPVEIIGTFLDEAPVDVIAMAEALGLPVQYERMSDDISGSITCDRSGRCSIQVNSSHSSTRQRFTIAHEIAHYALHRDLIGDGVVDNALYRSEQLGGLHERQANNFAARTLMPKPLVEDAWREGRHTAHDLAAHFEVSVQVAEIRMRELGCVLWPKRTPEAA